MAKRSQRAPVAPVPANLPVRYGTVPLRFFLGLTFLYAGMVKLADPGFLTPGSHTYLGSQMQGFATQSPIGPVLTHVMIPLMPLTGIGVIALELAVGAATLLGVYTRLAAAAGAAFSFSLFLTASWSVQPYFLGSDSIYTVAWTTLALVGDLGILSLQSRAPALSGLTPAYARDLVTRREFLGAAGGAVALVWVLAVLPRGGQRSGATSVAATTPSPSPAASASAPPGVQPIASLSQIESEGAVQYTDARSGDPAIAVSLGGGRVVAYDAVCTHAGCTVGYDPGSRQLVCPCHGGTFDPANGAVLAGPPPQPLSALHVTVTNGNVYPAG